MEKRSRTHQNPDAVRCPSCGFKPEMLGEYGDMKVLPSRCVICDCPLSLTRPTLIDHDGGSGLEKAWASWQEARRVERWIWFLFMIGLALAATIGLIRGG